MKDKELRKLIGSRIKQRRLESVSYTHLDVYKRQLQINQDAVRIMKELYGIDMEAEGQYSKLIDEIPVPDIAISMCCNAVSYTHLNCSWMNIMHNCFLIKKWKRLSF